MKDTKMYEALLGLEPPWRVRDVDLRLDVGEVVIHVEADRQRWACPGNGGRT